MGRNPQTGEAIKIPAKTVVKFRLAKAFKDAVVPSKSSHLASVPLFITKTWPVTSGHLPPASLGLSAVIKLSTINDQ